MPPKGGRPRQTLGQRGIGYPLEQQHLGEHHHVVEVKSGLQPAQGSDFVACRKAISQECGRKQSRQRVEHAVQRDEDPAVGVADAGEFALGDESALKRTVGVVKVVDVAVAQFVYDAGVQQKADAGHA